MRSLFVITILMSVMLTSSCGTSNNSIVLATTTSTYDTGLLDHIVPDFEEDTGIRVEIIAVGTGQALAMGAAGDADVVLVHARTREDQFISAGDGIDRRDVMCNDFVIVGSPSDPAQIAGTTNAAMALQTIANAGASFVSRGDDSGTHIREQQIWQMAGITPDGEWYLSIGQGMGSTLTFAEEENAYTLSDRGTFAKRKAEGLGLDIVVEGDPPLMNPYGVMRVNPEKHPNVSAESAKRFVDWLVSAETLTAIESFTINGETLFFTNPAEPSDCLGG